MTPPEPAPVAGLANPRGSALERVPIRAREASVTLSAWRLAVSADGGDGTITLVELPGGDSLYRGDGAFLGWSQDRLSAAYQALAPRDEAVLPDSLQLG